MLAHIERLSIFIESTHEKVNSSIDSDGWGRARGWGRRPGARNRGTSEMNRIRERRRAE